MCKGASFILSVNPDSYGFQNVILCFSTKVYIYIYMEVSINTGTSKTSIYRWISHEKTIHFGVPPWLWAPIGRPFGVLTTAAMASDDHEILQEHLLGAVEYLGVS